MIYELTNLHGRSTYGIIIKNHKICDATQCDSSALINSWSVAIFRHGASPNTGDEKRIDQ